MKPSISQNTALLLGFSRGIYIAGMLATALMVLAHRINPAVTWLYPGLSLGISLAARLVYGSLLDKVMKSQIDARNALISK